MQRVHSPEVNDNLLRLLHIQREIVVTAPPGQAAHLAPVVCLISVADETHHSRVICKFIEETICLFRQSDNLYLDSWYMSPKKSALFISWVWLWAKMLHAAWICCNIIRALPLTSHQSSEHQCPDIPLSPRFISMALWINFHRTQPRGEGTPAEEQMTHALNRCSYTQQASCFGGSKHGCRNCKTL